MLAIFVSSLRISHLSHPLDGLGHGGNWLFLSLHAILYQILDYESEADADEKEEENIS